jgi:hypothetical protein
MINRVRWQGNVKDPWEIIYPSKQSQFFEIVRNTIAYGALKCSLNPLCIVEFALLAFTHSPLRASCMCISSFNARISSAGSVLFQVTLSGR